MIVEPTLIAATTEAEIPFHIGPKHDPKLREVSAYLPPDLETEIFTGRADIETLWSSYKDHGYGHFFYALTRVLQPVQCIELGVLQGFSLLTVAAALRENGRGTIDGFDLFEEYPYHHEDYANLLGRFETFGLSSCATANRAEAFQVQEMFDTVGIQMIDEVFSSLLVDIRV